MSATHLTLSSTLDEISLTARRLLQCALAHKVWLFHGEMGAGKTTLIKALCNELGVQDVVNSPTFSIVQEYITAVGEPIYHFDFYRIQDEEEAALLDCIAYFESGHYCFIEWPSKIASLIPSRHCDLFLHAQSDGRRRIELSKVD